MGDSLTPIIDERIILYKRWRCMDDILVRTLTVAARVMGDSLKDAGLERLRNREAGAPAAPGGAGCRFGSGRGFCLLIHSFSDWSAHLVVSFAPPPPVHFRYRERYLGQSKDLQRAVPVGGTAGKCVCVRAQPVRVCVCVCLAPQWPWGVGVGGIGRERQAPPEEGLRYTDSDLLTRTT